MRLRPAALRRRPSRDTLASAGGAALFSLSLGLASVALPLLALRAGYSGIEVGVLTAVSAVAQVAVRMVLGPVMRSVSDWVLIAAAGVLLAASNLAVVASAAVIPFVVAELLQGVARGCFWTGSQTHVVRGEGRAVGALATVNLTSNIGLLGGPALAGWLSERSPQLGLGVAGAIAAMALVPALLLQRHPPFSPPGDRPPGRLWRRPGVHAACWAGVSGGAWRSLLGSYVPVALDQARQSSSTIGILVSVANGASLAGSATAANVRQSWVAREYVICTLAAGLGTGLIAFFADSVWLAGAALVVSGVGAGVLQTVGPAIAAEAVHPQERGEAIAAAGTFRAGALFLAPIGVAGLMTAAPLTAAMGAVGLLISLPAVMGRGLRRHLRTAAPAPGTADP
ncbi:MAG: MFS transporter [Micromonosporaceae bacterium]